MSRYSKPNFQVCGPRVQVSASLIDTERGSKTEPVVDAALDARISRPLRAMPVLPRASMLDEVTVPESDTPSGSYPAVAPNAVTFVSGLFRPNFTSLTSDVPMMDCQLPT